ncbi:membrane domain protein, partial [Salmonella enterica subsp. enterica serovar Dublin]|nr:membrane domain protein [Salmonella enterica subsp. enterica serovar Dublin]
CKKGSDRRDTYSVEHLPEYNIPSWLR